MSTTLVRLILDPSPEEVEQYVVASIYHRLVDLKMLEVCLPNQQKSSVNATTEFKRASTEQEIDLSMYELSTA